MSSISAREFEAALPAVLAAISRASFVAIDCEFSGLAPRPALRQTALDCVDARWAKVRAAAGAMQLLQFGVCTFELEAPPPPAALSAAGDGAAGDGAAAAAAPAPPPRFIARPFAFHLFPRASAGGRGADAEGDDDVTFLSSAGSLGFLSSHGFDLNAAVAGGVSYMSRDAERRLRHARRAAVVRSFLRDQQRDEAAEGGAEAGGGADQHRPCRIVVTEGVPPPDKAPPQAQAQAQVQAQAHGVPPAHAHAAAVAAAASASASASASAASAAAEPGAAPAAPAAPPAEDVMTLWMPQDVEWWRATRGAIDA